MMKLFFVGILLAHSSAFAFVDYYNVKRVASGYMAKASEALPYTGGDNSVQFIPGFWLHYPSTVGDPNACQNALNEAMSAAIGLCLQSDARCKQVIVYQDAHVTHVPAVCAATVIVR